MRFLGDMGISPLTVAFHGRLGHDAAHRHDETLDRLPDPEVLDKARNEDRVLLSSDLDFGDLMAQRRARVPSVVLFRLRNMRPEHVNVRLEQVLTRHADDLAAGVIVTVSESAIRVRRLPIATD